MYPGPNRSFRDHLPGGVGVPLAEVAIRSAAARPLRQRHCSGDAAPPHPGDGTANEPRSGETFTIPIPEILSTDRIGAPVVFPSVRCKIKHLTILVQILGGHG